MATLNWRNYKSENLVFEEIIDITGGRAVIVRYDHRDGKAPTEITFKTPEVMLPFGGFSTYTDLKTGKVSANIGLALGKKGTTNKVLAKFRDFLTQFDKDTLTYLQNHIPDIWGEDTKKTPIGVAENFTDSFKKPTTKKPEEKAKFLKYDDQMQVKVSFKGEDAETAFPNISYYNTNGNEISHTDIIPGSKAIILVKHKFIYCVQSQGNSYEALQVMYVGPGRQSIPKACVISRDEEDGGEDDFPDSDEERAAKQRKIE